MARSAFILLTRPASASAQFESMLRSKIPADVQIVKSPLIDIQYLPISLKSTVARTPVFTSRNGVMAWKASDLPAEGRAFCVGDATAEAACSLGFDAISSNGDVSALKTKLLSHRQDAPFLHVSGIHTRGDLVEFLQSEGLDAQRLVAYDQRLLPLSDAAKYILEGQKQAIVPLFSPRTAAQFARECPSVAHVICVAMSPAVAAHVSGAIIAETPDAHSMINAILDLL